MSCACWEPTAYLFSPACLAAKVPIEVDTDLLMRDFVLKNQVIYGTVNAGKQAFEDAIRTWPNSASAGRMP